MNFLPFAGAWYYGATSDLERASYYCSYGLLGIAPTGSIGISGLERWIPRIKSWPNFGRRR